jgi:hypothetical protein
MNVVRSRQDAIELIGKRETFATEIEGGLQCLRVGAGDEIQDNDRML